MKFKFHFEAVFLVLSFFYLQGAAPNLLAGPNDVETIICIRHGEKPPGGLGQLSPKGLQRSLALPDVLLKKFGAPQFVFAPDPAQMNEDNGTPHSYVRPLATIEPTAIRCGLPVNAQIGYKDIDALETELTQAKYHNAVIFVAWEHIYLEKFARQLVKRFGGNVDSVPTWPEKDYDSIYIIRITDGKTVSFSTDQEGLNNTGVASPSPTASR